MRQKFWQQTSAEVDSYAINSSSWQKKSAKSSLSATTAIKNKEDYDFLVTKQKQKKIFYLRIMLKFFY